jgi:CRP/FNR family transcriptional regulator, anaerobic regulatory protein
MPLTKYDITEKFSFCRNNSKLAEELALQGRMQTLPEKSAIYVEGDSCSAIALVISGEIRVYKSNEAGRELTLYEIGPGDTCILNASCILAGIGYPANAVTAAKTEVLLLPAGVFRQLLDSHSELQFYVYTMLSQRLTAIMALIEEIVFNRLDRRLFDYLLERSENNLVAKTHQNIANDLGTSREVISRLLKDFAHKGIVRGERNVIEILDYDPPFFAAR